MNDYYDRNGEPIELLEWARLQRDDDYKEVAVTEVCEGVIVSTVWLGLDHGWGWFGPPGVVLIFESMVFTELDEPHETPFGTIAWEGGEMHRYSTEAQALAGHDQMVAELRAQFDMPIPKDG